MSDRPLLPYSAHSMSLAELREGLLRVGRDWNLPRVCEALGWEVDDYSDRKFRELVALEQKTERFEPETLRQALEAYRIEARARQRAEIVRLTPLAGPPLSQKEAWISWRRRGVRKIVDGHLRRLDLKRSGLSNQRAAAYGRHPCVQVHSRSARSAGHGWPCRPAHHGALRARRGQSPQQSGRGRAYPPVIGGVHDGRA